MRREIRLQMQLAQRRPELERLLCERARVERADLELVARGASDEAWLVMVNEWRRDEQT